MKQLIIIILCIAFLASCSPNYTASSHSEYDKKIQKAYQRASDPRISAKNTKKAATSYVIKVRF